MSADWGNDPVAGKIEAKPVALTPAIKTKDGLKIGKAGGKHEDIGAEGERGFVDDKGNWLDRKEAGAQAQAAGLDVPDSLHTSSLNNAVDWGNDPVAGRVKAEDKASKLAADYKPGFIARQFPKAVGGFVKDLTGPTKEAWDALKADFEKSKMPKDIPDSLWGEVKQDFGRMVAMGKLPADAFRLALAPIVTGPLQATAGRAVSEGMNLLLPKGEKMTSGEATDILSMAGPGKGLPSPATTNALRAVRPGFSEARAAGYVVAPIEASEKPGTLANALQAWGGKIKTAQAAATKNQQVTNRLAAEDLGLSPTHSVLDEATFKKVRADAGKAYETVKQEVSNLPSGRVEADQTFLDDLVALTKRTDEVRKDFPELAQQPEIEKLQSALLKQDFSGKAGLDMVAILRNDAKGNLKNWADPEKRALGLAQKDAADAIEELIDRNLAKAGKADLVDAYRKARVQIAKSYDLEAATDAYGNVDARKLAAMATKRPFTGKMKTIADTAEAFPRDMTRPAKFGGHEDWGITDLAASALSGKWDVLGLAIGRPIARSAALSEGIQNRLAGLRQQTNWGRNMVGLNALASIPRQALTPPTAAPMPQGNPQPLPGNALVPLSAAPQQP